MTVRRHTVTPRCLAVVYRAVFYALAAAPVWGAAVIIVAICRRTHLS